MLKEKTISYKIHPDGTFSIENYTAAKPFSNFLPAVAGPYGVPLWAFYVNRGQCIASFGIRDKDNAIAEFLPANRAYAETPFRGFRTFIKAVGGKSIEFYEPFQNHLFGQKFEATQWLHVRPWGFSIEERNMSLGLEVNVDYFTLPNEPFGALVRKVTFKNSLLTDRELEIVDGLPAVVPSGLNDFFLKNMSRTVEAWMHCERPAAGEPVVFFKMRSDPYDRPEYRHVEGANFYSSFAVTSRGKDVAIETCVDPAPIFGPNLDFSDPRTFLLETPFRVPKDQMTEGRTPCAFSCFAAKLEPSASLTLYSIIGYAKDTAGVTRQLAKMGPAYLEEKRRENEEIIRRLMAPVLTVSGERTYDLYCPQTFLDNVLRGGHPWIVPDGKGRTVFHLYSRKHGDLERDYNQFVIHPTNLSQGDGNYRDMNQNRRTDVSFEPRVGDANVRTFFNLLQADGFNPLVLKELRLKFRSTAKLRAKLKRYFGSADLDKVIGMLASPRTPGEILGLIHESAISLNGEKNEVLGHLFDQAERLETAEHSQGFWTDHWSYNLDLLENYLSIFPEAEPDLLFRRKEFTFFDSAYYVKPRVEKYFRIADGSVRQFSAVGHDIEKAALIQSRTEEPDKMRTRGGRGAVYRTTLAAKIVCLIANKFASLDPEGVGLEMEADRPDWLDSLNGLPGLLGSSISGTFELRRLIGFLGDSLKKAGKKAPAMALPVELNKFLLKLRVVSVRHLARGKRAKNLDFWNATHDAKEEYWEAVRFGFRGAEKRIPAASLLNILKIFAQKLDAALALAHDAKQMCPTYFINEMTGYRLVKRKAKRRGAPALQTIVPLKFRQRSLPSFLEGPVHAMKIEKDPERTRRIYETVRASGLYDRKLGMYRVCAALDGESPEVGRIRVFTPGWLENQSSFMHMAYKFLLELLRKGMYDAFFTDMRASLVAFQDPRVYGRSIFENSSFIVSSAHGDKKLHGTGFAARLSGSTSEFLEMWLLMNIGPKPFFIDGSGRLALRFSPVLAPWLFTRADQQREVVLPDGTRQSLFLPKHSFAFLFLGRTLVVYHNPRLAPTYGARRASVKRIMFQNSKGENIMINDDVLAEPHASAVREGRIARLDVELG